MTTDPGPLAASRRRSFARRAAPLSRSRPAVAALLLAAGWLAPTFDAAACTCALPEAPDAELAKADAVFRGQVVAASTGGPEDPSQVTFAVSRVWKGSDDPVQTLGTAATTALCGYPFAIGKEYLVYAQPAGRVSSCSRTRPIDAASDDLEALGAGDRAAVASNEDVVRHAHVAGSWFNPARDGEGFLVDVLEDGRGLVFWFRHAPWGGAQAWLYGVGEFDGDTLLVSDMLETRGGSFGDGFRADPIVRRHWGELRMTLYPGGRGEVEWSSELPGYGSGSFELQRLTRPPRMSVAGSGD